MGAPWSTLGEWRELHGLSAAQFAELEAAGIAPDVVKCAGMKIVTSEADARWEQQFGMQVVRELFHAAGGNERAEPE